MSEDQARAILELQLHRLTGLEREKIHRDLVDLGAVINDLLEILGSQERIFQIIRDETTAVRDNWASKRRTEISDAEIDIDVEDLTKHKMDSEELIIGEDVVNIVNQAKDDARQICAVGFSVLKAIESAVTTRGHLKPFEGWTNKFIFPPYDFTVATSHITNFHLPLSTMLMQTAAFCGYDFTMHIYQEAMKDGYRFGAYGDAMLVI
jgi:hypothetical protein